MASYVPGSLSATSSELGFDIATMPFKRAALLEKEAKRLGLELSLDTIHEVVERLQDRCWLTSRPKIKYSTLREAKAALCNDLTMRAYPCECLWWHIGHSSPDRDPSDRRGFLFITKEEVSEIQRKKRRQRDKAYRKRRKALGKPVNKGRKKKKKRKRK